MPSHLIFIRFILILSPKLRISLLQIFQNKKLHEFLFLPTVLTRLASLILLNIFTLITLNIHTFTYKTLPVEFSIDVFLLFADNQILIAADEYDMEYKMRKISETYDRHGLKVNFAKTKYLVVEDRQNNNLVINGKVIEVCEDYKYLGVTI